MFHLSLYQPDVQIKWLLMPSASSGKTLVSLTNNQPIQPPATNHIVYQIQHTRNISSNINSSSLLKQSLNKNIEVLKKSLDFLTI